MKIFHNKLFIALIIGLASVLLSLTLSSSQLIQRWEKQFQDILYRNFKAEEHPEDVVIIAIDQNSLNKLQDNLKILWPWPRDIYAAMTEYLNHCNATTISYDIIFSSPDIDRLNIEAEYADSLFAFQMKKCGRVVLASQMEDSTHSGSQTIATEYNIEFNYNLPEKIVHKYPRITLPIPRFQRAMAHPGTVNFFTDSDGTCRKIPLIYQHKDKKYPYMALTTLLLRERSDSLGYNENTGELIFGEQRVPIDKSGFFHIYWYGPGGPEHTFKYVSAYQVLQSYMQWKNGQTPVLPPEIFENKAIFIGATAAGLLDLKTTPFSLLEPFPGVEIYATLYSNVLNGDYVQSFSMLLWTLFSFGIIFILSYLWQKLKVWQSTLITLFLFSIPFVIAVLAFQNNKMLTPFVFSEISIVLSLISVLSINYLMEGREKKLVKKVFNRYLHPQVVASLTEDPSKLEMGGREIVATSLFTDLQGFTTISEYFTPREIVKFLNDYFEKVEQIIFKNDGMLDKYTGDGIMAIFGAPVESQTHAKQACNAILAFNELSSLKITTKNHNIPLITRVGVHSGSLVIGNIGSSNRMDFTAIGDTVNLSARLEGVNKIYSTQNIISEATYEFVKDEFVCLELDFIRVKGRLKPLRIYNVICRKENLDKNAETILLLHEEALNIYREGKFRNARKLFEKILEDRPNDTVARVFVERCDQLKKNPKLIDKDGIFNINVK